MKLRPEELRLYAITDRTWAKGMDGVLDQVEAAIKGGATFVQVREKHLDAREFLTEARWVVELCHKHGVRCVINDNIDIALLSGADGVHVGQDDMACAKARVMLGEGRIIGVSAHTIEEAVAAEDAGADYLGSGAAFPTNTKDVTGHYVTPEEYAAITSAVKIPVVAIGGIHKDNILKLKGSGADGVALVSAIFSAEDIEAECKELKALTEQIIYSNSTF